MMIGMEKRRRWGEKENIKEEEEGLPLIPGVTSTVCTYVYSTDIHLECCNLLSGPPGYLLLHRSA